MLVAEPSTRVAGKSDRCLVLDAAFNPPTVAHWELALAGARVSKADWILIQLSSANVDKGISGADLGQRLYMLDLMAAEDERVGVSACSHARFVDKALALSKISNKTKFIFAIGFDTLERLFDPNYYTNFTVELETLFAEAEFVVANRGEKDASALDDYLRQKPQSDYKNKIHQTTLAQRFIRISSSETRDLVMGNQPFAHLVPDGISYLIEEMGLYKD